MTVADLERYEMAGSLLLCRACGKGGTRMIVKDFGPMTPTLMDLNVEAGVHESERHEPVFESPAEPNIQAARRSALRLGILAAKVERDVERMEYYRCYPDATAYRDGMVNGMGGHTGDLAGLLGPQMVRPLVRILWRVTEMGKDYPELVIDHDRASCDDFNCLTYGDLIEIAKAIEAQLPKN